MLSTVLGYQRMLLISRLILKRVIKAKFHRKLMNNLLILGNETLHEFHTLTKWIILLQKKNIKNIQE